MTCSPTPILSGDSPCDYRSYFLNDHGGHSFQNNSLLPNQDTIMAPMWYIGHGSSNIAPGTINDADASYFKFSWSVPNQSSANAITDIYIDVGTGGRYQPMSYGGDSPRQEHINLRTLTPGSTVTRTWAFWPEYYGKETHAVVIVYIDKNGNEKAYAHYPVSKHWMWWDISYHSATANGVPVPLGSPIPLSWNKPPVYNAITNTYAFQFRISNSSLSQLSVPEQNNPYYRIGLKIPGRDYPNEFDGTALSLDAVSFGPDPTYITMNLSPEHANSAGFLNQLDPHPPTQKAYMIFMAPKLAQATAEPTYPIEDLIMDWTPGV